MSRWRFFGKLKEEEVVGKLNKGQFETEEKQEKEKITMPQDTDGNRPKTKNSGTLKVLTSKRKKTKSRPKTGKKTLGNIGLIEEEIDKLHTVMIKKYASEIEKKVDHLDSGIKIEKPRTNKKTPGTIYILRKPKNHKTRGNWAIQTNGVISNYHRLKENAIKEAKNIAKKKKTIIKIQNIDRSFSEIL
jgi:hypothetical protein